MSSSEKISIYYDTGADITFLKPYDHLYSFFHFPYDSEHRRKKKPYPNLATPSEATWQECNPSWDEIEFTFADFQQSEKYPEIIDIVGLDNRRDALHLDSAYKVQALLFLTSDKKDIWNNRERLEKILGFRIFHTPSEKYIVLDLLEERK